MIFFGVCGLLKLRGWLPLKVLSPGERLSRLKLGLGCDNDYLVLHIAVPVVEDEVGGEASGDADDSRQVVEAVSCVIGSDDALLRLGGPGHLDGAEDFGDRLCGEDQA